MPQELRNAEYRSGRFSFKVYKVLECIYLLSSPAIIQRGLQDYVLQTIWAEATVQDIELILYALIEFDNMIQKQVEEKESNRTLKFDNPL